MNKVSIITPSYNVKKYFLETFNSVINQTYKDFEWIIVDDCSTDGTYEFIKETIINHNNIKLLKVDVNGGSAKARNVGLRNATGKYVTFLDADDLLDPTYLEEQVKFIEANGPIITAGYRRMTSESNTNFIPRKEINYKGLLIGNDASCLTTMYDREVIGDVFFPEDMKRHEDFVFWLNILKKGYIIKGNQQVLATYRILKTSKNGNKFKLIKPMYHVYHDTQHFNWIKSLFYVFKWGVYGLKKYKDVK